jgi:AP-3 complex subunit delta-1
VIPIVSSRYLPSRFGTNDLVKYVALLAFNKIVLTHPYLVAQQEDVIMECIDSPDISIRLRALDLVVGMVSSENLMSIVGRLMRQLRNSRSQTLEEANQRPHTGTIDPIADSDDESPEVTIKPDKGGAQEPLLPDDYRVDVISRILEMCASNNYGNLEDFDWYIDILIQLIRSAPLTKTTSDTDARGLKTNRLATVDISEKIGDELRSVAVKVKAVRASATHAAEIILLSMHNDNASSLTPATGALRPLVWIVGEYASHLETPDGALTALLHITRSSASAKCLVVFLQALPKIFALIAGDDRAAWTPERKTMSALLMARLIHVLEPLAMHPDLEVQERAVEFVELLKLAAEASAGQEASSDDAEQGAPLLLTQAIPSLFSGQELNSVAAGAQRNVPMPQGLDLDEPINTNLSQLLRAVGSALFTEPAEDESETYYHRAPPSVPNIAEPAANRLGGLSEEAVQSYQHGGEESYLDPDIVARRRAERLERNKDDPFYIAPVESSGTSTPLHSILQSNNGPDLDLDSIPIMQLKLDGASSTTGGQSRPKKRKTPKAHQRIQIAADETLGSGTSTPKFDDSENSLEGAQRMRSKGKQSLLQVDSSHVGAFSLEEDNAETGIDFERQQREEAEMAKAMKEVERLRLEMQRANERIQAAQGVSLEGTVVKKKTKKKAKPVEGDAAVPVKKKKAKKAVIDEGHGEPSNMAEVVKPKKKKKKLMMEEGTIVQGELGEPDA